MMASMAFLAMLGLSVALVAGFFGTLHPAFDSFAHFRIHLAVLMALIALPLLATSFRLQAGVGAAPCRGRLRQHVEHLAAPVAGAGRQ